MEYKGPLSIYINVRPKRWRITKSYGELKALERLSYFRKLGNTLNGVHEGVGVGGSFVLHIIFASQADKEAYEQDSSYKYFLRKLQRHSKRGGFQLLTN